MNMTESELKEVLCLHKMWLDGEAGGKRANLSNANLHGADLSYTNLRDANLSNTDLSNANLTRTDLCGANMVCANLSNANLLCANLSYTDLNCANLCNADLSSANMNGANLCDADLSSAKCGFNAFFGSVKGAPFYQAMCGFGFRNATLTLLAQGERKEWRWFTGCFEGSEEELRKAVAEKHGDSKAGRCYLRAIDYLIAQAEDNTNSQQQS